MAVLTVMLMGFGTQASAQFAISDDEAATQRRERILENLKYQLPQLRGSFIVMGEITASDIDGLDEGSFMVNGRQSYSFLVTSDDATLYLLSADPIDVSLSSEDIAAALEEERQAAARQAAERHQELTAFAANMPVRGNPDAPVTIFEFSDFQCPYCARGFTTVEQILEEYPNDVKFVYLHFPLENHPWAMPAAIAAVCAAEQGDNAFWILHDSYFRNQRTINPSNVLDASREFLAVSGSGIDLSVWSTCAGDTESEDYQQASAAIASSMTTGSTYGVEGTPGFFVNGHFINGALPLETFEELIDEILEEAGR
ncbi:MAG: thioredoxin domain-containing protein [Bacteroidetes bacterium]|nr:thioredoxin domain-containing protein [Bacteroidota bacterium]